MSEKDNQKKPEHRQEGVPWEETLLGKAGITLEEAMKAASPNGLGYNDDGSPKGFRIEKTPYSYDDLFPSRRRLRERY